MSKPDDKVPLDECIAELYREAEDIEGFQHRLSLPCGHLPALPGHPAPSAMRRAQAFRRAAHILEHARLIWPKFLKTLKDDGIKLAPMPTQQEIAEKFAMPKEGEGE